MSEISVAFEPAKIEVLDREKFEEQINSIAEANLNRVVTAETLKDDKNMRAELRKLYKSLNDEKIRIKKEYNKPLTDFEMWFKKAVAVLDNAISQIDDGVKEVEFKQKEERKEIVRAELLELTKELELDSRIFEVMIEDWAKSSNFNDYKPKKSLQESIAYAVEQERLKQEEHSKNKKNISNFAFMSEISDTPYIHMYEEGKPVSDVLDIMNKDILKEKERKEAAEAKRKVEEQERQELANQQLEKDFKVRDQKSQSEPIHDGVEKAPKVQEAHYATIEFRFDSVEQKDAWKAAMNKIGLTQVVGKDAELTAGNQYKATSYRKVKM